MKNSEMKYRHEYKYPISDLEASILKQRLKGIMSLDSHVNLGGGYTISSLYFDDYQNSCYYENENGTDPREKFRIRTYNNNLDRISLECKRKERGKTLKTSCLISKKQVEDSQMDLVVAATKDGVLMVESEIGELDEKTTLGAVKFGFDQQQTVINAINEFVEKAGKERWEIPEHSEEYIVMEKDFEQYANEIRDALLIREKLVRLDTLAEIHAKAKARIPELFPETTTAISTL